MTDIEDAAAELALAEREWRAVISSWIGEWEDLPREVRLATRRADERRQAAVRRLVELGAGVLARRAA